MLIFNKFINKKSIFSLKKNLLFFSLFSSIVLYAQIDNDSNYIPKTKKIIITGASGISEKNSRLENPFFLIKISPFSFFRGEIPLHLEIKILKKLSIELTPFYTKKEYITPTMDEAYFVRPFENKGEHQEMEFENMKFKQGSGRRVEIRLYTKKMFDGLYMGLAASSKQHFISADIPNLMMQGYAYRNMDFSYKSTDYRLTFGYSRPAPSTPHIYYDFAFGIGTRNYMAENYPKIYIVSGTNWDKSYNLTYGDFKSNRIAIFGNIKMGFTF